MCIRDRTYITRCLREARGEVGDVTDLLGSRDQIGHVLALDNVEDVSLPPGDIGIGWGNLKGFGHGTTDGAELALQWVGHNDPDAMLIQAPRQRQCRGKTSNCQ